MSIRRKLATSDRLWGLGSKKGPAKTDADAASPSSPSGSPPTKAKASEPQQQLSTYDQVRRDLYRETLEHLETLEDHYSDEEVFKQIVTQYVNKVVAERFLPLSAAEKKSLAHDVVEDATGLGPLAKVMADPAVSDIFVNGPYCIYVERYGKIEKTDVCFEDEKHLMSIIHRMVERVGRHVDESSPLCDARLEDGSRINVTLPPLSLQGPLLSIRRFGDDRLRAKDLVELGGLSQAMLDFMHLAVECRANVLVSGGTGCGKTTLLAGLCEAIPEGERVITIEDAAELKLRQSHVVTLETRPPNSEGKGAISTQRLVINSLRMRPDRVIVGECRGAEAFDMLQAMNTGHDGSLTTVHANTPRDAVSRIESMVLMGEAGLPARAIREQIVSAIDIIVQASRLEDGSRRVIDISEVVGVEGDAITMQSIFEYKRTGLLNGKVQGHHAATGVFPYFAKRIRNRGREVPAEWFVTPKR